MRTWESCEQEFESWWQGKECFCFAFHDTREAMGATGSRRVFTAEQPSDYLVTDHGSMFYAEVKSSKSTTSFPFSNIKPGQWKAAIRQTAALGNYFFFLYSSANDCWYKIPSPYLISSWKEGRKSVKWTELTDFLWTPPSRNN